MQPLDQLSINTIRFLAVDAVQKANSGHPGLPMGAAPMAYTLWTRHLKHHPGNPRWFDRDRFVLSGGHGSMLLYALLHLTGYDLPLAQLQNFRQWESATPGHPERDLARGIETSTGPLGQGFANGVGMAIAEKFLAARYNRGTHAIVNHFTYAITTDGDLMEGISHEAASLAGHLKLGKLIYLYDDNHISLAASTNLTFTEDRAKRFEAYGWHTQIVGDGNDIDAIDAAIKAARAETERPSIIMVRTIIGFGAPHKQNTFEVHGSPLGADEVKAAKENLQWPLDPAFYIPGEALEHFREAIDRGAAVEKNWNARFAAYKKEFPDLANELETIMRGDLPANWDADIPSFPADAKGIATRVAGGQVLNAIAKRVPNIIGGSADLDPSTMTMLKGMGDFLPESILSGAVAESKDQQGSSGGGWSYAGRNIHFGVREMGMASIVNGLAVHGGIIPFGATFLVFSDYMRPTLRLAAMMHAHSIFVFTHDSIGLGEDGPTHQPIEHLASLRAIPGLIVLRPGDANEVAVAWRVIMEMRDQPVALVLTRQTVPTLDRTKPALSGVEGYATADGLRRGAYVLSDPSGKPDIILIATGSEVQLIVAAQQKLAEKGIAARLVSMPSWELFDAQPQTYRDLVLPPNVRARLAVEAGVAQGWRQYVGDAGDVIAMERYGASAPYQVIFEKLGFTVDNVVARAMKLVGGK